MSYSVGQSWAALKKAWRAYKIAKAQNDKPNMLKYAERVRTLQGEAGPTNGEIPRNRAQLARRRAGQPTTNQRDRLPPCPERQGSAHQTRLSGKMLHTLFKCSRTISAVKSLKLPRARVFQVAVVAIADFLIGYLVLETLDSFTGAHYSLPISAFLVSTLRLEPFVAGTILAGVAAGFSAVFVYWLWRRTPLLAAGLASGKNAGKVKVAKAGEANGAQRDGAMRVGAVQYMEGAETHPFVDVVQLEGYPLNVYAAVTKEEGREGYTYVVIEPTLSEAEKARLDDLKKLLVDELDVDLRSIDSAEKAERYLSTKAKELSKKYGYKSRPPQ